MLPGPLRKEGGDGGDHDETNGPAGGLALTESSALKEYTILVGPVTDLSWNMAALAESLYRPQSYGCWLSKLAVTLAHAGIGILLVLDEMFSGY